MKKFPLILSLILIISLLAGCAGTPVVYYTNCTCPVDAHEDVVVDEVNFVDSKSENPASSQGGYSAVSSQPYIPESYSAPAYASPASSETPKLEVITDDDELPF